MSSVARACWCGASSFEPFAPDYLRCTSCETLVGQAGLSDEATRVRDDSRDYYGKRYWLDHQREDLGLPDIYARARLDLPERCAYWLKALLRYRRPPGPVLEVGAGHGGYSALLQWAGFEATALDLSPWAAQFARERFGVQYLVGPVEEQDLEPASFEVIVANDVIEHLAAPRATMAAWIRLLRPGGLLIFQTPEYVPGRAYSDLVTEDDPFLEHVGRARREHLYLFSRRSVARMLEELGLAYLTYEEPVYSYDMFGVAAAEPVTALEGDVEAILGAAPTAALVVALLDAHDAWQISERDRADRLDVIHRLDAALRESEADRAARLAVIEKLDAALKAQQGPAGDSVHARERVSNLRTEATDDEHRRWPC